MESRFSKMETNIRAIIIKDALMAKESMFGKEALLIKASSRLALGRDRGDGSANTEINFKGILVPIERMEWVNFNG